MKNTDFDKLVDLLKGKSVERPNRADSGTLSGHAAGEPFEKLVYHLLKGKYPKSIYKQYEFLNDLYMRNPRHITVEDRYSLFESPVALFLLNRGDAATRDWNPTNIFEERQNDTADILGVYNGRFNIIDVKTRNMSKRAMPPNIISAYKLAKACSIMLDNEDFESVNINYIEVEWVENGQRLICNNAYWRALFLSDPSSLYINWAAAMQIQFHVSELDQTYTDGIENWARSYIKHFVGSAESRCNKMYNTYVKPFKKYITK